MVVQTDDATLLGRLVGAHVEAIELADAAVGDPHGRAVMDGTVVVPLLRVSWVQVT